MDEKIRKCLKIINLDEESFELSAQSKCIGAELCDMLRERLINYAKNRDNKHNGLLTPLEQEAYGALFIIATELNKDNEED